MTDNSLVDFLKSNPFWAVLIIILTVLPIIGAVVHILLKAFGRRGLDNIPPTPPEEESENNEGKANGTPSDDKPNNAKSDKDEN